jgi:T5SS/PEP-CTERM-associated repeat protein
MKRLISAGLIALSVAIAPVTRAQYTGNNQTNIMSSVTNNWSGSYIVGSNTFADVLLIQNSGVLSNGQGYLGYELSSSNNSVVVNGSGSLWRNAATLTVGSSGSNNRLIVTNSGNVTTTNLIIGATATALNNLVSIDGGRFQATNVTVGELGAGELMVSNGTLSTRLIYIGSNSFSVGALTLADGSVSNAATFTIGAHPDATGALWVKGGLLHMAANTIYVGRAGTASMTVSDGVVQVPGIVVGLTGAARGTFTQSGGTVNLSSSMTVGGVTNTAIGTAWITGGHFFATNASVAGALQAGNIGPGMLTISNAAVAVNELDSRDTVNIVAGTVTYRTTVDVSGGGPLFGPHRTATLLLRNGTITPFATNLTTLVVGFSRPGSMVVSDGTVSAGAGFVGFSDGDGTLTLNGGGITLTTNLYVGVIGTGTLWMAGGQFTQTNTTTLIGSSGPGAVTLSNGLIELSEVIAGAGSSGVATLTSAGGMMRAFSSVTLGSCSTAAKGVVSVVGGSVFVTNATHTAILDVQSGTVTISSGTLAVDNLVMTNSCGRFMRPGGSVSISSTNLDPSLDADGDGMANGWEQAYGLDPLNAADASADNDGDGQSNLQEFQTGTDPTNSASAFRILNVVPTNDDILVSWTAGGGRTNVVQSAPDVAGSYTNVSPNIILTNTSDDATTNYLDAGAATNASSRFYRIRLVP